MLNALCCSAVFHPWQPPTDPCTQPNPFPSIHTGTLLTAHCTLHTAHCTLHTAKAARSTHNALHPKMLRPRSTILQGLHCTNCNPHIFQSADSAVTLPLYFLHSLQNAAQHQKMIPSKRHFSRTTGHCLTQCNCLPLHSCSHRNYCIYAD